MKAITLAGNIGKSAETRRTPNGDAVTSWSLAVEERKGSEKRTIWFDCSLWGKRGEKVAEYITKGSQLGVSGELGTREHEGKTYLTVRVSEVTLQGGTDRAEKPRQQDRGTSYDRDDERTQGGSYGRSNDLDDEIPFAPEFR